LVDRHIGRGSTFDQGRDTAQPTRDSATYAPNCPIRNVTAAKAAAYGSGEANTGALWHVRGRPACACRAGSL